MSCIHPVRLKAACTSFKLCECGETRLVCNILTENTAVSPGTGDVLSIFLQIINMYIEFEESHSNLANYD